MTDEAATRCGRPRLETLAEAEARNLKRIDALFDREPEIAVRLEACEREARCGMIVCAVCARKFRFGLIRKLLRLGRLRRGPHEWATVCIDTIPEGALADVNLHHARDRLRQRLRRSGFAGSILAGILEVSWLDRRREWVLHIHLLAIRVPEGAWDALEDKLAASDSVDPLDVAALENPERQISYSIKFVTYHRPGKAGLGARAPARPLPPDRLAELARWWSRYQFDDFVFLLGAHRQGDRIEPWA